MNKGKNYNTWKVFLASDFTIQLRLIHCFNFSHRNLCKRNIFQLQVCFNLIYSHINPMNKFVMTCFSGSFKYFREELNSNAKKNFMTNGWFFWNKNLIVRLGLKNWEWFMTDFTINSIFILVSKIGVFFIKSVEKTQKPQSCS